MHVCNPRAGKDENGEGWLRGCGICLIFFYNLEIARFKRKKTQITCQREI